MFKDNFVIKGDICYSSTPEKLTTISNGYVVCIEGIAQGAFETLPEQYARLPLIDHSRKLIIPGLVDLHIHAPQFAFRGIGMDLELLDWLKQHTFPEEARYGDLAYAEDAYKIFVDDLLHGFTTRSSIFATIHRESTLLLMQLLEKSGLVSLVGKVNMDRNSPETLREKSASASLEETTSWLELCESFQKTRPILTPRFIPSCTDELMRGLSEIQERFSLPVQSHLSENHAEIAWVKQLCPTSKNYADAYARFNLFGENAPTIMAHCVWCTEEELEMIKERNVFVAHCPQSNENLSSGIAPVRSFLERGISVGLGSDVAGGCHTSIFRAMTDAIQVSKLYWRLVDDTKRPLLYQEAFYLGTVGGGAFFGKVGRFEEGYEFDALVIDDTAIATPLELSLEQRLERTLYLAETRHLTEKYVAGERVFSARD